MNQESNVLPVDFDGVFRFTNYTDRDFVAKWANVEYTFPANKTSPMIIPGASPEQVQNIRKKFAKELAEREFYQSDKLKRLEAQTPVGSVGSFRMAAIYTEDDLKPFIQKCLEPLPIAPVKARALPKRDESNLRKDNEGKNVTRVLKDGESLLSQDSSVVG